MQDRLKKSYGDPNCPLHSSSTKSLSSVYTQPVALPYTKPDHSSSAFSPIFTLSPVEAPLPTVSTNDFSALFSEVDDVMPGPFDDMYTHGRIFPSF